MMLGMREKERHEQIFLSGDRGGFQNSSVWTRSDADTTHMSKALGIIQMRQTRSIQIEEDACIQN